MLAAFSVPLDRTDDEIVISQCLEGFRCAVHVTAAMSMKTQRDAFITSLAKFTSLHSAADIKQKNIEAIKVCYFLLRCKCSVIRYSTVKSNIYIPSIRFLSITR
jgi:Sec7-like guanine-nucleotide exchange factor